MLSEWIHLNIWCILANIRATNVLKICNTIKGENFTALYLCGLPLKNIWQHLIFSLKIPTFFNINRKGWAIMRVTYNCIQIIPFRHTGHGQDHISFIIHNSLCLSNQKNLWLKQVLTLKNKNKMLKFLFHSRRLQRHLLKTH